jgi:hypothetical protein
MAADLKIEYRQHTIICRAIHLGKSSWFVSVYQTEQAAANYRCIGSAWAISQEDAIDLGKRIVDQDLELSTQY